MNPIIEYLEPRLLLSAVAGDVDLDGDVDAVDLAVIGLNWDPAGTNVNDWSTGDFDGNGNVDSVDLAQLGLNWNPAPDGLTWTLTDGNLEVFGTNEDDLITVSLTEDGRTVIYWADSVQYISQPITSRVIWGLEGNDTLISIGGAVDIVYGGVGRDICWIDTIDSATAEVIHEVDVFFADAPITLDGQDLVDPIAEGAYYDHSDDPLFVGEPVVADIRQGSLGDCYLLAAAGAIVEADPSFITDMMVAVGDGTYILKFSDKYYDEPSYSYIQYDLYVRIDGELPGYASGTLRYAAPGLEGEIWMPILEKGYAMFSESTSSYLAIESGWMATAHRHMTSEDSVEKEISNDSANETWARIQGMLALDYAVSAGSYSNASYPIIANHAYVVIETYEVGNDRFVILYNPWGSFKTVTIDVFQSEFEWLMAGIM